MIKTNIKTALTKNETLALCSLATGRNVIEIGSLLGYSTIQIASTANKVLSIDPHCGYPYYNPTPTYDIFKYNIQKYGVDRKINTIVNIAQKSLPYINNHYDMAFIDCTGFYEDTKYCLENSKVETLCVHDFLRRGCNGVEQAVLEFVKVKNKSLRTVDTLAIIE